MVFEWDEDKNIANHKKHGIWFEEAQMTWLDVRGVEVFDHGHSDEEERFLRVAYSRRGRVLLTVFCERSFGNRIRIISSRRATETERRFYEKGI